MMRPSLLLLSLLSTLPAQREAAASSDYRAGRYQDAYAAFAAELAAAGDHATAEQRWNTALAALRLQRSADAEAAITPLLASDAAAARADAEFVLAMCRHQRGELAAAAAQLPDAEPMAWTLALRAMQQASEGFLRADAVPGGWPAARRNAERCQRRLQELERERARQQEAKAKQEPAPPPPPEPTRQPQPEEPAAQPAAPVTERLSPAELAALLQRGQQRDRRKRAERQAAAAATPVVGDRDW